MDIDHLRAELRQLHDAVFLNVAMNWATGDVTLSVRCAAGLRRITIGDAFLLECPRQMPWGPSVCVNHADIILAADAGLHLQVEMQSGDNLIIKGHSIAIE